MGEISALTSKQQRYVEAFKGNHREAARAAGYKDPATAAASNASKPHIIAAIKKREDAREQALAKKYATEVMGRIATRDEIMAYWTNVMTDEDEPTGNRLAASNFLAKAKMMYVETHVQVQASAELSREWQAAMEESAIDVGEIPARQGDPLLPAPEEVGL